MMPIFEVNCADRFFFCMRWTATFSRRRIRTIIRPVLLPPFLVVVDNVLTIFVGRAIKQLRVRRIISHVRKSGS